MKILLVIAALLWGSAEAAEIEGVPFVKQASNFCGPASLESVMAFYGAPAGQDWQLWSASMYVYATACVEAQRTPLFDEVRGDAW